jgi:small subunit ribosomal protein S6
VSVGALGSLALLESGVAFLAVRIGANGQARRKEVPLPAYELMFIVKPELDEEQVTTATDRVHQLIVANGGSVSRTSAWGKRRLAYNVGPFREGYYVVSNFSIEPTKISELERVLKISDTVFRHLLVRRDKPLPEGGEVEVPEPTAEDLAYFEAREEEAAPAETEPAPELDGEPAPAANLAEVSTPEASVPEAGVESETGAEEPVPTAATSEEEASHESK